ncbi:hypothetical protein BGZ51_009526 [Haplosporangium sp. Z 767]|nr:hypothetical protein BGZ50_000793 [Haplosporangium sp. Z 11]KAF9194446.1 hypothetical protein BGZ51_009526 [Haplosporangium sp. Z 767]
MSNRKRRRFHGLASLLLVIPTFFLHVPVDAVPTPNLQSLPAAEQEHNSNNAASGGVFHSIGFQQCGSSALSSSPDSSQSGTTSDTSSINLSSLGILYDATSNTISVTAAGSTEREVDASSAHILLTAYDRVLYNKTIDLTDSAPITTRINGQFSILKTFAAPSQLQSQLPKQLFYVPALEAVAAIQLYDRQGSAILCTTVPLTNTVSATSPSITVASVSLTAASVALTAITSLLATFSSAAVITSIPLAATGVGGSSGGAGSANPSGGLSPSVWDVVSFCQFIAMSGSLNLNYPELFRQWTLNFGWSMGLVQAEGWNRAINALRAGTSKAPPPSEGQDGVGTKLFVNRNLESTSTSGIRGTHIKRVVPSIARRQIAPLPNHPPAPATPAPVPVLPPPPSPHGAALLPDSHDKSLMNRVGDLSGLRLLEPLPSTAAIPSPNTTAIHAQPPSTSWSQNNRPLTFHGLNSFGQRLDIPAENMFMTSLFLFFILLLATSLLAFVLRLSLEGYAYFCPGKFTKLRRRFGSYYLGNMLRVMLLSYFAVATMAFYQLTLQDTWLMNLLAVLSLLLFFGLITFITLRLRRAGGTSLFFDERLKSRYGVLYDQYFLSTYWFFVPVLGYQILKAAIVGLGQGVTADSLRDANSHYHHHHHGSSESWAQTSLLLLVEVLFAALLFWKHPFADKAPNRLNGVLSCVRVLNVVLLAILIEDTAISTVSRTVVGMVITATQAIAMLVLGLLVFYQLGKALWRLGVAFKANKDSQTTKKQDEKEGASKSMNCSEDVLVVSIPTDKKDEDENPGRSASEQARTGGDKSMASLVDLMDISSNPTIQYTPASDDEADKKRSSGDEHKEEEEETRVLGMDHLKSKRISVQSVHSESSHILDYYNPSYLPSSFRSVSQQRQKEQYDPHHRNDNMQIDMEAGVQTDHNLDATIEANAADQGEVKNETWVQSAYMTRRRSVATRLPKHRDTNSVSLALQPIEEDQFSHRNRRRPVSVGGARQNVKSVAFAMPSDLLSESPLESSSSMAFVGPRSPTFDVDPPVGVNLSPTDAHHVDMTLNDDTKDPKQILNDRIPKPVSTETLHDPPPPPSISSSIPRKKRLAPGLRIITALRPPCPPPQIPLPTLLPTPFSASLMTEYILQEVTSKTSTESQQQPAMIMKQPTTPNSDGSCTPPVNLEQILMLEGNGPSRRRQLTFDAKSCL